METTEQKLNNIMVPEDFEKLVARIYAARDNYGPYRSLHEAYGVLLEEIDELWQIVKMKRGANGPALDRRITEEALDIAAVALRIANLELDTER